ncbi:MAG: TonB-dependent receptor, partial [Nitrospira sp.]|nr:TonB-dependent receptor [Nitrospira sp.]
GNPTAGGTGNRLFLAAKDSGSLWSTYEFQDEALRGLKVGGGVVAVGERQGDVANTYQLAGYVTANLMASYQWHVGMTRLTAQLNVNNLFDVSHFAGSNAFDSAVFGMPRFFMGSIRMEF